MKAQLMIRFLQEVASGFEAIYILGDFFDVWPGTTQYQIQTFRPFLETFRTLVKDGHRLRYLEGNHDFRLGHYFSNDLGIEVFTEEIIETLGGRKVYMAHGDLGNPAEKGYRALRYLLRRDLLHQVISRVPAPWLFKAGECVSRMSRGFQKKVPPDREKIRQIYRATAEEVFEKGYDVVIMGHTHIPDHYTKVVGGRTCHYYNTGDWLHSFTYLEFDGAEFYTRTHPVKDL